LKAAAESAAADAKVVIHTNSTHLECFVCI
jgi:hypothetical protein